MCCLIQVESWTGRPVTRRKQELFNMLLMTTSILMCFPLSDEPIAMSYKNNSRVLTTKLTFRPEEGKEGQ